MIHPLFPYPLYLVISESDCYGKDMLTVAEQAILGGVDIIQLREKDLSTRAFLEKASRLKELTDKHGISLIINDNLTVAMQVQSYGIHVGNSDIAPTDIRKQWTGVQNIGYSIECLSQLHSSETEAADYLGISPVFSTPTKRDTITEWGLDGIRQIASLTDKPLVAIGNMKLENVEHVIAAGAHSVAVVSAICAADDPQKAAFELKNKITK
ncbi:thiamine phosphate synthase [Sphingobacterium sp. SYP-B4668]|uniref:thiamine phosphate synthase n=1 Tax=Sphingobacterium sp. SYP-B4668 TaxID=2996035 RepID=UPI0022DD4A26|nr:thiamine phosphate synthase [Sphingobacterium sp. SYP-B4668]